MGELVLDRMTAAEASAKWRKVPSPRAWETVISNDLAGIALFPNAAFGQGILQANSILKEASRERVPVAAFFNQDPPQDLVIEKFGRSKIHAHAHYGIPVQTDPQADAASSVNVWSLARRQARSVLANIATFVGDSVYGPGSPLLTTVNYPWLFDRFQDDIRFQTLVAAAAEGTKLDEVKVQSGRYTHGIDGFLKKYPKDRKDEVDIDEYLADQAGLDRLMHDCVDSSAHIIKSHMLGELEQHFPHAEQLRDRLVVTMPYEILGRPQIAVPDPLRIT